MSVSFKDVAIVACGTMKMEIDHLKEQGFIDTENVFFTPPGLHQDIRELEKHLVQQVVKAKAVTGKVIVVYGGKFCYVNADNPSRTMQTIIDEQGSGVVRINATHCMDMIADAEGRDLAMNELAGGEPVFFMTPGWVRYRHMVFKGWDRGIANENFPRHTGGVVVLDCIGFLDRYMEEHPEEFLDYCDWMGVPMQACPCSSERFKSLLSAALKEL